MAKDDIFTEEEKLIIDNSLNVYCSIWEMHTKTNESYLSNIAKHIHEVLLNQDTKKDITRYGKY